MMQIKLTPYRYTRRHTAPPDVTNHTRRHTAHPDVTRLTRHHCTTPNHTAAIDHAPSCPGPPASAPRTRHRTRTHGRHRISLLASNRSCSIVGASHGINRCVSCIPRAFVPYTARLGVCDVAEALQRAAELLRPMRHASRACAGPPLRPFFLAGFAVWGCG
jgi:hypothetical protein